MNNWFKLGMPVLAVILLIVCAVTITLLAGRYGSDRAISSTGSLPLRASAAYAGPGLCPNCPGYTQSAVTAGESSTAVPSYGCNTQPSCHVSDTQGSNNTGGYGRDSCCGGYHD